MANPQLEDGHTRIANELLDTVVRLHLSPNQWQILFFIIRKTYGYRKKVDYITNTQIVQGTGIHKAHVSRAMSNLVGRKILNRQGKWIGLQKDYDCWIELPELVTKVTQSGNSPDPEKLPDTQPELPDTQPELPEMVKKVTSSLDTQKKKETIQKKLYKRNYGEFNNVLLTDEELAKLRQRLPAEVESLIEQLSCYIKSKGKKYKSHYATLLNWYRMSKERQRGTNRNPRELPTNYTRLPEQDEDED